MFIKKTTVASPSGFIFDKKMFSTFMMLIASLMVNEQIGVTITFNRSKTSIKVSIYDDRLSDDTKTQWINDNEELELFIEGFAIHYNLQAFKVTLVPLANDSKGGSNQSNA